MTWFNNDKKEKRYKIKTLKTFAWDRARSNKKKYRSVFDRHEINYLSVSLELYNKLFDEEEWKVKVTYKAYTKDGEKKGKEHCSNTEEHTVSKETNVAYYEYGWGNKEYGKYWKEGDYIWEVYIDDNLVGTTDFRIEEAGVVTYEKNPYFDVQSLKTYEAPIDNLPIDKRVYLKQFKKKGTRYIMAELKFVNKLNKNWQCELFFNFYDDTGLLVGVSETIDTITKSANKIKTITTGWGNEKGNSWIKDNYRVEVVYMDTVIAMIPFKVAEIDLERTNGKAALINKEVSSFYDPNVYGKAFENRSGNDTETKIETKETQKEILEKLDRLVGLKKIKNKIRQYIDYVSYLQFRKEKGIEEDEEINLHSVFTGNPGTGKTTVVKLLGKIYHSMGILSSGHVHTVSSSDLMAGYVRQTGEKTRKVIEKARGGILFIDEAYMLYKPDSTNDYGPEAIAELITEMSDGPGDIAIMVAGYPKEMEGFINSNPGLKSRFRNYYHFDDYTPTELVDIAKYAAKEKDVILDKDALLKLKKIVTDAYRDRDRTFGNARLVHTLVDEAKMNLGIRLMRDYKPKKLTKELLTLIKGEDIRDLSNSKSSERLKLEIDNPLLEEALEELNSLVGLSDIKQEVQELIRLTKYYKEINRDILNSLSLHTVFLGNPGTGKTTVARIMGKVYKALGLLERGHVVEADGGDLIAGYIGQTAIKTKEIIKRAMGGILFIDEAYAITENNSSGANYGKEAIATLIKEMEDHRGEFGIIVAGYTDNMKHFLEANPGMKSRFDKTFHFIDFTEQELWDIAVIMLKYKGLTADKKAEKHIKLFISHLYQNRNKFFGNARSIRKLVEKAYRNQELRMANLEKDVRTKKMMATLTLDDVIEFDASKIEINKRKSVGFK